MFLSTLVASLLGNPLTVKWAIETSEGQGIIRAVEDIFRLGEGTVRAGHDF